MDFTMSYKCQPKSHTHLQFAQANAQTKNCKRVCLANPLKERLEEQITGHNKVYKSLGSRWLIKNEYN